MGQVAIDNAGLHYEIAELEIGRLVLSHEDRMLSSGGSRGNPMHVDVIPSRQGGLRPALGLGGYRTPVDHLYIGGAGSHPGGGLTGGPGRNAAQEILRTLRREDGSRRRRRRSA